MVVFVGAMVKRLSRSTTLERRARDKAALTKSTCFGRFWTVGPPGATLPVLEQKVRPVEVFAATVMSGSGASDMAW